MKQALWTLAAAAVLVAAGAAAFVWSGWYDVSATAQHLQPVYTLLERVMHRSVRRHARGIVAPDLQQPARLDRGAGCYRAHCVQCHGGPGQAVSPMARSMQPLPGPLVDAPARWTAGELYWITRHGIKMSGMPAWQQRLPDDDLWAVVAFVMRLPALGTQDYRRWMARLAPDACAAQGASASASAAPAPDAARGRGLFHQYACNACHVIPGVTGARVHVGPPLGGLAGRTLIAGKLPNTPDNLVRWLREPAAVEPHSAMPDMEVPLRDARDMAAYLGTLH